MIEKNKKKNNSMKKLVMIATLLVAGMVAQAQPKVTSAYNANKEGKFEAAKGYIDEALVDPKATEKEKFWRYRGNIYSNIVKILRCLQNIQMRLLLALSLLKNNLKLIKEKIICRKLPKS